jgi:hypothetical protein
MAFNLTLKTGDNYNWHIGAKKPVQSFSEEFQDYFTPFKDVLYLEADGDELQQIRDKIQNIPICHNTCIWRDNLAQFIYDNL